MSSDTHRVRIPAVFMRGGTSKGVFFHERCLPPSRLARDRFFVAMMGSPDPYQRQLDGMGGGLSSVSKVVIIAPSVRSDADVDYTFVQIAVDQPVADYGQACGNLSASVGPFAVEEGLVQVDDGPVTVRVYNTNTDKIFHAHFEVRDGLGVEVGDFVMAGVPGSGAEIRLDYLAPGGSKTVALLPTGNVVDTLRSDAGQPLRASLVDATNPVVFLDAASLGLSGSEAPAELESDAELMASLDALRRRGAVMMGIAGGVDEVPLSTPKIALLSRPTAYRTLAGEPVGVDEHDVGVRIVSMQRMHRAVTGTGAMCLAAACRVEGSVAQQLAAPVARGVALRIGTPSGVLPVAADVSSDEAGRWDASSVTVYRTQRRLMEGWVLAPRS